MKRVIKFTKLRYVMFLLSFLVIGGGITGTILNGGFNLGIDFQAGLNQRIQIAPVAMDVSYTGKGDADIDIKADLLTVAIRGEHGVKKYPFVLKDIGTLDALAREMNKIDGFKVVVETPASATDLTAGLDFPLLLSKKPSFLNVTNSTSGKYVTISQMRSALTPLGNPQVQVVGKPENQEFQVRIGDPAGNKKKEIETKVVSLLRKSFGQNVIVVKQSNYVGPKFSSKLAQESIGLTITALVLVLIYLWFRFKLAYGVSAISALFHDVLVMLGFIGTFRLEVNTTTIAAVLTIVGYSLNDTIVVFDRIRENSGLLRGEKFSRIINISITQSLSRTIITSLTTLLAVLALYFFGTGSIKDFALNLIVGIIAGTYSSIFIASPILLGWTNALRKKDIVKSGDVDKIKALQNEQHGAPENDIKPAVEIPVVSRKLRGKRKKKK